MDNPVKSIKDVIKKQTAYEKVLEFYNSFKMSEYIAERPGLDEENMSEDRIHLKVNLIAEEFFELLAAVYNEDFADAMKETFDKGMDSKQYEPMNRDIVETADALADMLYVILNLAIESGVPFDAVFKEVHDSNMSKLDDNGEPIVSDGTTAPVGKILKSEKYFRPDIKGVIERSQI